MGQFKNSEITGQGKYSWPSGASQEGNWVKGKMEGHGKNGYLLLMNV